MKFIQILLLVLFLGGCASSTLIVQGTGIFAGAVAPIAEFHNDHICPGKNLDRRSAVAMNNNGNVRTIARQTCSR